jgi:membrane dipeptidase
MRALIKWAAILTGVAIGAFLIVGPGYLESSMNRVVAKPITVSDRARELHVRLTIVDLHADTLMWQRDLIDRADRGHVDLPRLQAGNVALQVFASVTKTPKGQNYDANGGDTDNITALTIAQLQPVGTWTSLLERSLWHAEKLDRQARARGSELRTILKPEHIEIVLRVRARGQPIVGALLAIEGLQNLEGKRENLAVLHKAGFRMAGLTHFFDNELAGSMHGLKKGGLTPFGRQIVTDMEASGMVVDIAHCSHQCVAEVLAMATKPVVSSHGGVQATCKVNRNLSDDEIRGVARTGGVVGIGYWDAAVCDTSPKAVAKAIVHVRNLVGIDHVGLGSDYDGATTVGFDTSQLVQVTQALIDAGLTNDEIAKVMGGNVLRVLMAVLPAG